MSGSPSWCFQNSFSPGRPGLGSITNTDEEVFVPGNAHLRFWYMHVAIYRKRPDIGAIVHTHSEWASVFAICRMDVPLT